MKKMIGVFLCALFVFSSCRTNEIEKPKSELEIKKSNSAKILSFLVKKDKGGFSFSIDERAMTVILTLPEDHGLSLSALAPEIKVSKWASVSPASKEIQDFSDNRKVSYTVTAEDGSVKTYNASVVVLPARGNLTVDSIFICGVKVEGNAVTVAKDVCNITLKDIQVNFKGEYTPSVYSMSPEEVILNKRGDSLNITLSTKKTDRWNMWNSPSIKVTRDKDAKEDKPISKENKILSFKIGNAVGIVNDNIRRVTCEIPTAEEDKGDSILEHLKPTILCSPGALIMPYSGVERNFRNGPLQYTVKAENGASATYTVSVTRKKSSIAKIRSFRINGRNATIDHDNLTVALQMPRGTLLTSLVPEIKLSYGARCNITAGGAIDFSNSDTSPIQCRVTAEDNVTQKVYEITVQRVKSNEAYITKFVLIGKECVIDNNRGTIILENVERGVNLNVAPDEIKYSPFASISPSASDVQDFSRPVTYTVTAENTNIRKEYTVKVKFKKNTEALITSFKVGSSVGTITNGTGNEDGTIKVGVPKSTDLKKIKPEIIVSAGATVTPKDGEEKDFTSPVEYIVTAEDGKTTKKYLVTITKTKSDVARMATFTVDGKTATIDQNNKTIYLEVPFKTNLAEIKPVIVCEDDSTCEPKSGATCDFSDGKTVNFKVTSEDGKTEVTYVATIKKYPPDSVITVFTSKSKRDGDGNLYVVIGKDKNKIEHNDVKITYMEGAVEKEIDKGKFTISGDQTTLPGDNGYMTLKITLKLGNEFINAAMFVKIVKTEPQQP